MKRVLFIGIVCASLAACAGGNTYQVNQQLNNAAKREADAWQTIPEQTDKNCPHFKGKKPVRSEAMERYECWASAVREKVIPVAIYPIKTNELLLEYQKVSIDYKKGAIDRDEAKLRSGRIFNQYISNLDQYAREMQTRAYQMDLIQAEQNRRAFRNAAEIMAVTEKSRATATTNCIENPMGFSCTTE